MYTQVEVVWEDFSFELHEGLGVWSRIPSRNYSGSGSGSPPKPLRFEY